MAAPRWSGISAVEIAGAKIWTYLLLVSTELEVLGSL